MVETCCISLWYATKQLEYVTKDHIATYTILLFKTTLFFSFLVV